MSDYWATPKPEPNVTVPTEKLKSYVKSTEFQSNLSTQYKGVIQPTVFGCSISYDMSSTQTGSGSAWTWGYTSYDNGGFHNAGSNRIVIPEGLAGLYLILADVSITPTGGTPATTLDMNIVVVSTNALTSGGVSSRSFGTGSTPGPLDWSSNKFLQLDEGDNMYLAGGSGTASGTWKCPLFDNHLSVIKFPFGS